MASTLITALITFAATNIDDIFVLLLFFSQSDGALSRKAIVVGQYLGFSGLVLLSLLVFVVGLVIPREWIGLLGFAPIFIGIKKWRNRNSKPQVHEVPKGERKTTFSSLLSVAAVTFANGGDNIGVYSPLFANSSASALLVTLVVFYILLGFWCYLGHILGSHPAIVRSINLYGHLIVPFVLIGLGIYILVESGTILRQ